MVKERKWGKSNLFSELHRKNIPGYLCLFDIDGIYSDGISITGIYEGKYYMNTSDGRNFIESFDSSENIQAAFLKEISNKIPVWICEESTDKWWNVKNSVLSSSDKNRSEIIDSSDRIYIGYSLSKYGRRGIYSIFHRTLGIKPPKDDLISSTISSILGCKKILVNDSIQGKIYFKDHSLESHLEAPIEEGSTWKDQWKELGLI